MSSDNETKEVNEGVDGSQQEDNKQEQDNSVTLSKDEYSQLMSAVDEVKTLKSFHQQVLTEKQQEKEKRQQAQRDADKKIAEKENNVQELLRIQKEEFEERLGKLEAENNKYREKEIGGKVKEKAKEIADSLSKHAGRNSVLTEKIASNLIYTELGVKVKGEDGKPTSENFDSFISRMKSSYDFLCDAVDSNGSGAKGSITPHSVKNLKDMSESEQLKLFRSNPAKWRELKQQN